MVSAHDQTNRNVNDKKELRVVQYERTPYSMNRLFSESFRKFGGAILEVCETISGGIWQLLRGKIKGKYPEKKIRKFLFSYYIILFK